MGDPASLKVASFGQRLQKQKRSSEDLRLYLQDLATVRGVASGPVVAHTRVVTRLLVCARSLGIVVPIPRFTLVSVVLPAIRLRLSKDVRNKLAIGNGHLPHVFLYGRQVRRSHNQGRLAQALQLLSSVAHYALSRPQRRILG